MKAAGAKEFLMAAGFVEVICGAVYAPTNSMYTRSTPCCCCWKTTLCDFLRRLHLFSPVRRGKHLPTSRRCSHYPSPVSCPTAPEATAILTPAHAPHCTLLPRNPCSCLSLTSPSNHAFAAAGLPCTSQQCSHSYLYQASCHKAVFCPGPASTIERLGGSQESQISCGIGAERCLP